MAVLGTDGDLVDVLYCEVAFGEWLVLGDVDVDELVMRVADKAALNRRRSTMN